jgi:uncharacterized protein YbjT (DUF2867 family)
VLAHSLRADGHAVRGTTRHPGACGALEAEGIEPWVGDPDRLGTLTPALESVTVACWLLGSAEGPPGALAALHGPRLRAFCETVVDTTVRGLVYEAAGTVPGALLAGGAEIAREAARTWEIPLRILDVDPADRRQWMGAADGAVRELLDPPR